MRRLLVPPSCIEGATARLQGGLRHHLINVLRLGPGAELLLADGRGKLYRSQLLSVSESEVRLGILELMAEESPRLPRLTLLYGLSRGTRTELVLQKATELGVDEIQLVECRRSVARGAGPNKLGRWEEIIRQAARQCGRGRLPELHPPRPLPEVLPTSQAELRLLALPGAAPLSSLQQELARPPASLALLVGPEGGLTAEEVEAATAAGYQTVGLGPLVLRTETAALVFLALGAFLSGRLDG